MSKTKILKCVGVIESLLDDLDFVDNTQYHFWFSESARDIFINQLNDIKKLVNLEKE